MSPRSAIFLAALTPRLAWSPAAVAGAAAIQMQQVGQLVTEETGRWGHRGGCSKGIMCMPALLETTCQCARVFKKRILPHRGPDRTPRPPGPRKFIREDTFPTNTHGHIVSL